MELDEFIASTLAEIVRGVQRAQEEVVDDYGPWVSPIGKRLPTLPGMAHMPMGGDEVVYLQNVAFDVAITVSDKVEGKGEGGVKVLGIGASASGAMANQNTSASRVQFNVPLVLPGLRMLQREARLKDDSDREAEAAEKRAKGRPRYT